MVVMILQLSCLTHAESIRDVWVKANAPAPLGERLSCFLVCLPPRLDLVLHETFKVVAGSPYQVGSLV